LQLRFAITSIHSKQGYPCTNISLAYISNHVFLWSTIFLQMFIIRSQQAFSLPSKRQHLSCGDCLELGGKIISTVLCSIVYNSCAQQYARTCEQFLKN